MLGAAHAPFRLDREVIEVLRIVGREIALFIAGQKATQAWVEAQQFAEAGRRLSFVAHDIKNSAARLSLLLDNAEQHLENPAFRADMLAMIRSSVQRIPTLLTRLQAAPAREATAVLAPARHLAALVTRLRGSEQNPVVLETDGSQANVVIDETTFGTVIRHLTDNAIEAFRMVRQSRCASLTNVSRSQYQWSIKARRSLTGSCAVDCFDRSLQPRARASASARSKRVRSCARPEEISHSPVCWQRARQCESFCPYCRLGTRTHTPLALSA